MQTIHSGNRAVAGGVCANAGDNITSRPQGGGFRLVKCVPTPFAAAPSDGSGRNRG
jgi:hypothetical protein